MGRLVINSIKSAFPKRICFENEGNIQKIHKDGIQRRKENC